MLPIHQAMASSRHHSYLYLSSVAVSPNLRFDNASRHPRRCARRWSRDVHVELFNGTRFGATLSPSTAAVTVAGVDALAIDERVGHPSRRQYCSVLGAVVAVAASSSAASSLLGRTENPNNGCTDNCNVCCRSRVDRHSVWRRFYSISRSSCQCEPSSSKASLSKGSGDGKDEGGGNDKIHDSKSTQDSSTKTVSTFFDLAQQWASEYTRGISDDGRIPSTTGDTSRSRQIQPPPSDIQSAEAALLKAMGITTGGDANHADNPHRNDSHKTGSDDNDSHRNERNVLQRILVGLDEFKNSLPNLPSTMVNDAEVKSNNDSRKCEKGKGVVDDDSSSSIFSEFLSLAKNASLFASSTTSSVSPSIDELIQQAQSIAANHISTPNSANDPSTGFLSQVLYFQQNAVAIQRSFESAFGNTQYFSDITAVKDMFRSVNWFAALYYYLEQEDSIKTPSWKRRMHRYQRAVEVAKVEELNEALLLSELSYADSVDDIRTGLEKLYRGEDDANEDDVQIRKRNKPEWELLFCDTESRPNQPSHYLAIQKNASPYDDALHVLLVVRGTKSMSDLITDAMMEATDYEYAHPGSYDEHNNPIILRGKAHGGMQESGKYLVNRHQKLLSTLLQLSKKRKIDITLIGHSLGAGAATIAAMEWNSKQSLFEQGRNDLSNGTSSHSNTFIGRGTNDIQVSAHVIGFGCPALLSQPLSHATKDFVTTVIADADVIPRMSGATLVNLLLDVKSFDYQMQAERDVEQALREVQNRFAGQYSPTSSFQSKLGFNISEDDIQSVMGYVRRGLETVSVTTSTSNIAESTTVDIERTDTKKVPILFPPGECIHFYRDGSGISGTYVNCDFFNEVSR